MLTFKAVVKCQVSGAVECRPNDAALVPVESQTRHLWHFTWAFLIFPALAFPVITHHILLLFVLFLSGAMRTGTDRAPRGHRKMTLWELCWHSSCVTADATLPTCGWLTAGMTLLRSTARLLCSGQSRGQISPAWMLWVSKCFSSRKKMNKSIKPTDKEIFISTQLPN